MFRGERGLRIWAVTIRSGMDRPFGSAFAKHWNLDSSITLLNHGSFGATPRVVRDAAAAFTARMELEPVGFFVSELEPLLDCARETMAAFVGCAAADFAFVTNASTGVSTVTQSLRLEPGDELLTTAHEYDACNNALRRAAERSGATVVTARAPFPAKDGEEIAAAVLAGITDRTKLLLLSHITSVSAMVMPVGRIIAAAQARGVDVLLDSAHGPGSVKMNLGELKPAYATGNFHKWVCAPKGSAFLYVRPDRQAGVSPLTISHGMNSSRTDRSRFRLEFDYQGTQDPCSWLATPTAVEFLPGLLGLVGSGGWERVRLVNHELAQRGAAVVGAALGTVPPLPEELCASMALVPIPAHDAGVDARLRARPTLYADALQDVLLAKYGIQVPILRMPVQEGLTLETDRFVRVSGQLYNSLEQYEYLGWALRRELETEREGRAGV